MAEAPRRPVGPRAPDGPIGTIPASITIRIAGSTISHDVESFSLAQFVDNHHVMKLALRGVGVDSGDVGFHDPTPFSRYLGASISVSATAEGAVIGSERALEFLGVVTGVSFDNSIDKVNAVLITAHSPTIKLDGARRNAFFVDSSISDILDTVLGEHDISADSVAAIGAPLPITVQYRETDYRFVMRLATAAKKFAYYDGERFQVDDASGADAERLVWSESLGSFSVGLNATSAKFVAQAYNPVDKSVFDGEASLTPSLDTLPTTAFNESEHMFADPGFVANLKPDSQSGLDAALNARRAAAVSNMCVCHGQSYVAAVSVGKCVQIEGMGDGINGQYWILSVRHEMDITGGYRNHFTCVPLDAAAPQLVAPLEPVTDLQTATVVSLEDPEDQGRVKVKFHWNTKSADGTLEGVWLRVMTPHAGLEKGVFWIPDVDDEVVVAFEHGDPRCPMVLGSLYNGTDKPPVDRSEGWNSAENDLKVFCTKNGNEIHFHDADGAQKIGIVQEKNTITLDMSGPTITIESTGDIVMKGKTIELESTGGDFTIKSSGALKQESGTDLELKGGSNLKAEGAMNFEAKGGVSAKLSGTTTDVEGSAILNVKGGLVKIN